MPFARLRRSRRNSAAREMRAETRILHSDLVMPYFVIEGRAKREPIKSMPGIARVSIDNLVKDMKEARALGIKAVLLFGVSGKKDDFGSEAHNEKGLIQNALRAIKEKVKDVVVITDVCLCAYTSHGHCGILKNSKFKIQNSRIKNKDSYIDNDKTIKVLAKTAMSHARAGADFVAPSAMMDGQVKAIRKALDEDGFEDTG